MCDVCEFVVFDVGFVGIGVEVFVYECQQMCFVYVGDDVYGIVGVGYFVCCIQECVVMKVWLFELVVQYVEYVEQLCVWCFVVCQCGVDELVYLVFVVMFECGDYQCFF